MFLSGFGRPCIRRLILLRSRDGEGWGDVRGGCATYKFFACGINSGIPGEKIGPKSVIATTKHFPGGGPMDNGEDSRFA